jgi:hypothetical protein
MSWESWNRRRDYDDQFDEAESIRTRRLGEAPETGRAGSKPGPNELIPAVWNTRVREAVRRDDANGFYIDGR